MENEKVVVEEKKAKAPMVSNVDKLARLKLELLAVENNIDPALPDADINAKLKTILDKKKADRIAELKKIGINPDLLAGDGFEKNKVEVLRLEKLKRKEIADRNKKEAELKKLKKTQDEAEFQKLTLEQQKAWKAKKAEQKKLEDAKKPVEPVVRVLTKDEKKAELAKKEAKLNKELELSIAIERLKTKMEKTAIARQSVALDAVDKGKERKARNHALIQGMALFMLKCKNTDAMKSILAEMDEATKPAFQKLIAEVEARLAEPAKKDASGGAVANAKPVGGVTSSPTQTAQPANRPAYQPNTTGNK